MGGPGRDDDASELKLLSREELESQVRERTAYLENLMDTMVDVLLVLDPEGRIELANDALTSVLGYDESDVVGKPIDVIFARSGGNESLSDMLTEGTFVEQLLTDGYVKDVEVYFETSEGETVPTSISASVMRDEDGAITGIVCVAKDISERKEAEETAEFLHSLLRHDLGNKLQVTQGYLELLEDADGDEFDERLETARNGVEEAIELIENVRTLQRIDGVEMLEPVRLGGVLDDVVGRHEDLRQRQGMTIDIDADADCEVLAGQLLKELFSNLLENALVHSDASRIELSTRETGGSVAVTVEDDGRGLPPGDPESILEKGVTGPDSNGSGLGMHLAARIVDTYDGDIEVGESDLGGARFDVRLPRPSTSDGSLDGE